MISNKKSGCQEGQRLELGRFSPNQDGVGCKVERGQEHPGITRVEAQHRQPGHVAPGDQGRDTGHGQHYTETPGWSDGLLKEHPGQDNDEHRGEDGDEGKVEGSGGVRRDVDQGVEDRDPQECGRDQMAKIGQDFPSLPDQLGHAEGQEHHGCCQPAEEGQRNR